MALQDVSVEVYYDSAWHEIADQTFVEEEITILWGQGSESAAPRPGRITLTLDNGTDRYRLSNPESDLYGKVARNTPIRVSVAGVVQMTGRITSMEPDFTLDWVKTSLTPDGKPRGRATVTVEANGLLQQVAQWSKRILSPLTRYDLRIPGLLGYWPCEDERGATLPAALVPGGREAYPSVDVDFGSVGGLPGSAPLPRLGRQSSMYGHFATSTGNGYQVFWSMKFPKQPVSTFAGGGFSWVTDNGYSVVLNWSSTNLTLYVGYNGAFVITQSVSVVDTVWTDWQMFIATVSISGGTTTVAVQWYRLGDSFLYNLSGTHSTTASTGQPEWWAAEADDDSDGMSVGHVGAVSGSQAAVDASARWTAARGHPNETAGSRFVRVLQTEEGITTTFLGGTGMTSAQMGAQQPGELIEVLGDIQRTEDAIIYDDRDATSLIFRTRGNRTNQTAAIELTWPTEVSAPFREVLDDLNTTNVVTVTDMPTTEEAVARLDSGPMSTQEPPNGVGEYPQEVGVIVANTETQLPLLAGWWLSKGTLPGSRYPSITVDLVANPHLISEAESVEPGDLLTLTGYQKDPIYLQVIGIKQRIGSHRRSMTFTTMPAELYQAGVYDTARYDTSSTELAEAITSNENLWDIRTASANETLSTTGGYTIRVNGENETVFSMTAPTFSGGYYNQQAVVIRSTNGVVRTHSTGDDITIEGRGRYAF